MNDCFKYGSIDGCDNECPALLNGECENVEIIIEKILDRSINVDRERFTEDDVSELREIYREEDKESEV